MSRSLTIAALVSILLSGAIFGFFYAWVCSTMWGLDAADPRVAIAAMQAMNASVRNAIFAPAFFGTGPFLLITALLFWRTGAARAALYFGAGGGLYLIAGAGLTMAINVPMNEALAIVEVPQDVEQARAIWAAYSPDWQVWNQIRTVASGATLLLAALGFAAGQKALGNRVI